MLTGAAKYADWHGVMLTGAGQANHMFRFIGKLASRAAYDVCGSTPVGEASCFSEGYQVQEEPPAKSEIIALVKKIFSDQEDAIRHHPLATSSAYFKNRSSFLCNPAWMEMTDAHRFVQHVLPKGFMKIRHYGLLSSRHRESRLRQARKLLLPKLALSASPASGIEPAEPARCPQCGSVRRVRGELLPHTGSSPFACSARRGAEPVSASDTS